MKQIPQGGGEANWDNQLLQDLSFIKKNLRYPMGKKTVMPAILASISFVCGIYFIYWLLYLKGNQFLSIFLFVTLLIPIIVTVNRHLGVLKFIAIPTPYFLAENMQALQRFLEEERLVVFRHPDAPEVSQIISRNIDAFGDQREVLIFIADERRILINSHFTTTRKRLFMPAGQRHHRQMAKMLKAWLNKQQSGTAGVVRQGF